METDTVWLNKTGFQAQGSETWVKPFVENPIGTLFDLCAKEESNIPALHYLCQIIDTFLETASNQSDLELTRAKKPIPLDKTLELTLLSSVPLCEGSEHVNPLWLSSLWEDCNSYLRTRLESETCTTEALLSQFRPDLHIAGRIYFHLVENPEDRFPFAFLCTYATKVGPEVRHMPLKYALEEFKGDTEQLLHLMGTILKTSEESVFISTLVESGELFNPIRLTEDEAYTFLKETPLYQNFGIGCRIPNWWKNRKSNSRTNLTLGKKPESMLGLDSLLSYELTLQLNGEDITLKEIQQLLSQQSGLRLFKGKWVEINQGQLEETLQRFNELQAELGKGITLRQWMQMQMGAEKESALTEALLEGTVEVEMGTWLEQFASHTLQAKAQISPDEGFKATLRPYQEQGLSYLHAMLSMGFGTCLADDMGLGKTIQVLALLQYSQAKGTLGNVLLVVPSSLVTNWQKEASRFTPLLPVFVLHDTEKNLADTDCTKNALFITTYTMVSNRQTILDTFWDIVILDEAQAIKNPMTKQTKAVKSLQCRKRIALTGTPVENSLSDLWSLFDFLNPGLLGTKKQFASIGDRLKDHPQRYGLLRSAIAPFILRRCKTDKKIIGDLPEKIESEVSVLLAPKQVVLYKEVIANLEKTLGEVEGIQKKGLVLATILKCKQICNHPSQFLGIPDFKESASGKFDILRQISETVASQHEKMLVFTQFQEMTAPLAAFLETIFKMPGAIIDGKVPPMKRGDLVDRFNRDSYLPFMVLSIKAGGTGLNLTGANHVVHFDRWWNPAVENQATDRAFRIGQTKNVNVYKFTSKGTVEEKISALIESKTVLQQEVIGSSDGESWMAKLDNKAILDLFRLEKEQN
jgi:non-specific serine/threonine protein kinase